MQNTPKQSARQAAIDELYDNSAWLEKDEGLDPAAVAQGIVDTAVTALRRDARWRGIPLFDLELSLADFRRRLEQDLSELLDDRLPAKPMLRCAVRIISEIPIATN